MSDHDDVDLRQHEPADAQWLTTHPQGLVQDRDS